MNSAQSFVSRREKFVRRYYRAEYHAEEAALDFHSPYTFPSFSSHVSWLILALIFRAVKLHDSTAVVAPQRNKPGKSASHRTFSSGQIGHKLCSALPWHALFLCDVLPFGILPSRAETISHSSRIVLDMVVAQAAWQQRW